LGHEIVGEVLATTERGPERGTRVVVDPSVACGRCGRCREGRANLCSDGWLLGRDRDGGLQGTVAAPADNLYPLPADLGDHVAPLVQVLTTCIHGQRMTEIVPGDSVAVVGLGVTGLLHVQLAKLHGASWVVAITRSEEKLELARELGADVALRADEPDAAERALEASGGADVAIECAGTVATLGRAVRSRPGRCSPTDDHGAWRRVPGTTSTGDRRDEPTAAKPEDFRCDQAVASGRVRLEPLSRVVPSAPSARR
jgi:threonine dehydrogenase-like Zn-dependent dehydrogenase